MSVENTTRLASRSLVRTTTPGVFRRGNAYVVVFRDPSGKQHKRSAPTLAAARTLKAGLNADVTRGEYRQTSNVTFADHWQPWIDSYAGRTSRGFRERTRDDYRRALDAYAAPFFGRMRLAEIEPQHVKTWLRGLADGGLSVSSIRNIFAPLRAMLADAAEDGLIRSNPAAGVRVPSNAKGADDRPKVLTEREVQALIEHVPAEHQLLVQIVAETGVRISEALAWTWVDFDGKRLHVRRRLSRGDLGEPKSRFGVRAIPLRQATARALWQHRKTTEWNGNNHPLFASETGTALDASNLYHRVLRPARDAAGIEYGGWHRLRHTAATRLIESGARPDQAQRWLGHHDSAFTVRVYVHPADDDLPDPDEVWGEPVPDAPDASPAMEETVREAALDAAFGGLLLAEGGGLNA